MKREVLTLYQRMQDATRRGFGVTALLPLHFQLVGNPGTGALSAISVVHAVCGQKRYFLAVEVGLACHLCKFDGVVSCYFQRRRDREQREMGIPMTSWAV